MSHLFLTIGEFPSYRDWLWCPGFRPHWCPSPLYLRVPYLMFSIRSFCHWISIVFLLYGRRIATHSVVPSLTHFVGKFPGLGLAVVPDVVVPEAEQRCA